MNMDENIKSEEQRPSTKYRGNKESFGLFSSIGRLFSKLLNRLKNKIIDFLAVNPMPMEFPEMGKKAAKAPRKRPVGLFTIIGLVGKTVRILLNVTYKYGIKPIIQSSKPIIFRRKSNPNPNPPEVQSKDKGEAICPLIHNKSGKQEKTTISNSPKGKENRTSDLSLSQREERTNRPNNRRMKL